MSNKDFNMRAYIDIINESNEIEEGILTGIAGLAKAVGNDVADQVGDLAWKAKRKLSGTKLGQKAGEYKDAYNYGKYSQADVDRYQDLIKKYKVSPGDNGGIDDLPLASKSPTDLFYFRDEYGIPKKDAKFMADIEASGAGINKPGEAARLKYREIPLDDQEFLARYPEWKKRFAGYEKRIDRMDRYDAKTTVKPKKMRWTGSEWK
jgi:hypothetical protein